MDKHNKPLQEQWIQTESQEPFSNWEINKPIGHNNFAVQVYAEKRVSY